jgi:hypothetical protein
VTDRSAVGVENNGITSTIADDRAVASIQNEPLPFVLGDKLFDWFVHIGRSAPAFFTLDGDLLCPKPDSIGFQRTIRDLVQKQRDPEGGTALSDFSVAAADTETRKGKLLLGAHSRCGSGRN